MSRLLLASRPKELSNAPFDAFAMRHRALARLLAEHFDVGVLLVTEAGDPDSDAPIEIGGTREVGRVRRVRAPETRLSRMAAVRVALREPALEPWEESARALADEFRPDVVVTLGPWLGHEYRVLHGAAPGVHFFEEDLDRMPELAPQSAHARLLRRVVGAAQGRRAWQPRAVVAISGAELAAARRFAPRAEAIVVPLTLDPGDWPVAREPGPPGPFLVVANLAEARNAEGLAAVLACLHRRGLSDRLRVRVVTGSGIHPILHEHLDRPWVDAGPERGSLLQEYRAAGGVLVPAFRATGLKTTILQGWSQGRAVVTTSAAAAGVGPNRAGLAVGATSDEVVDALASIGDDDGLRVELAQAGLRRIRDEFDRSHHDARVIACIRRTAEQR